MRKPQLFLISFLIVFVGIAGAAQAAVVTVGRSLTGGFAPSAIGTGNTLFNLRGPANPVSPTDGAVVGWNMIGASGGPFRLRLLSPAGASEFIGGPKSAPATPLTTAVQHFDTLLPIKAGELVALDHTNTSDKIGTLAISSTEWGFFPAPSTPLAEGAIAMPTLAPGAQIGFNAEVQPAPAITSLGPMAGPVAGGTQVLIVGTELEGATAVRFGGTSAAFSQVSATAVIATSPPGASAGGVPVSVTTRAGTGTSNQLFTYEDAATASGAPTTTAAAVAAPPAPTTTAAPACVVPNVLGKRLRAAKLAIRARDCKLGQVAREEGVSAKAGAVVRQSPKPGTARSAGSVVNVKLGRPPA